MTREHLVRALPAGLAVLFAVASGTWLVGAALRCGWFAGRNCEPFLGAVAGGYAVGAVLGGVVSVLVARLVVPRLEPARDGLLAADRATLLALALLVVGTLGLAPFLLGGRLGLGPTGWLVAALPYYPTLAVLGAAGAVTGTASVPGPAAVVAGPAALLVAGALQTAWLYLLATALTRASRRLAGLAGQGSNSRAS